MRCSRILSQAGARDLLLGLADHSPYLWGLIAEDPARLGALVGRRRRGNRSNASSPRSRRGATAREPS